MKTRYKLISAAATLAAAAAIMALLMRGHDVAVLNPAGTIAAQQRDLIVIATLLGLIVVVPVFVMTFAFVYKYREGGTGRYTPNWSHNSGAEAVWWGVPILLIVVLGAIIWRSSHQLDPSRPIVSNVTPVKVQVVALPWKWLFIYPDQRIATINYLQLPVNTPVSFEITSEGAMNSFWIPKLGGQIYAMPGMTTQLHLEADKLGTYDGASANLSGKGFAGMKFKTVVTTKAEFDTWADRTAASPLTLTRDAYTAIAAPSENVTPTYYADAEAGLYDEIVMKYMHPESTLAPASIGAGD